MIRTLLTAFAALSLTACAATPPPQAAATQVEARAPVTILVSIDGFRPDYLDKGVTPNLNALAAAGVKGAMRPSFPSKTFPNHNTIVTGLRPDHHGIVDNNMEDPGKPGARFSLGSNEALDPFWWNQAEPIWVTAEKAGLRTGTMFWPGSEVAIHDTRPNVWQRFDQNISNQQRIDTILDWMRRPQAGKRPQFITLYFNTVDSVGHMKGPKSPEVLDAVAEVDARIGELAEGLKAMGQPVNFVITADHGMAEISGKRVVRLDTLLPAGSYRTISEGAFFSAEPQPGREAELAAKLLAPHEHMQCWRKEALPARFQYGRNPRVPSFFCLAETGWSLFTRDPGALEIGGNHGFDNEDPEMLALFLASGPGIKAGATLPIFDNVDVYPMLAQLIGVQPLANDGNAAMLDGIIAR